MARLGDVFPLVRNGASIKQTDGAAGIPITRIETISNREIDRNKFGYADIIDDSKYKDYILQDGDILMSHINSEKHLGKVALYKKQGNEQIIHGMNLLMLRANPSVLFPPFAIYFFETSAFLLQIKKITKKSVNQASFTVKSLKEVEIPLPPIDEQRKIAAVLDKVSSLIVKRKQQLDKLDEMVKARFVELLGLEKAVQNAEPLENFLENITYGFTNPMPDAEEGPWKITAKDIIDGKINFLTARKTTTEAFDALTEKSRPIIGDVLLTKDGTLGRMAIVEDTNICVNQSVAVLRCNKRVVPKILMYLLQMPEYQRDMISNAGGGTIKHIYITKVNKMQVAVPSMETQKKLLAFLGKIEKIKTTISHSLEHLETLKKALMQEYFG